LCHMFVHPFCILIIFVWFHHTHHSPSFCRIISTFPASRHFFKNYPAKIQSSDSGVILFQLPRFSLMSWTSWHRGWHDAKLTLARSRFQRSDSIPDRHGFKFDSIWFIFSP
jgi:hypothetical protein